MIITDSHVHTCFSADSKASLESVTAKAAKLGFTQCCFTDHMDYDFPIISGERFEFDPDAYFSAIQRLQEQYPDGPVLTPGIEIGLQTQCYPAIQSLMERYPFSYTIGSIHLVDGMDPYQPEFWEGRPPAQGLLLYLEAVYEQLLKAPSFDILGHMDYAVRYCPTDRRQISYEPFRELIDEILRLLIRKDTALEINTSSYETTGYTNPDFAVAKRYYELGGRLITLGSDAHTPERMGAGFATASKALSQAGFQEYAVYYQHQPTFFPW